MTTIVVSGAIANKWFSGGSIWTRLSYVLGLKQLGYRVHFVEQIEPEACVDVLGNPVPFHRSVNLARFRDVVERFGLVGEATLVCGAGEQTWGHDLRQMRVLAESADLLVNISGHLRLDSLLHAFRCKLFIDQDPGFTQFWHAAGSDAGSLAAHDYFFTVGENIGTPNSDIPTSGIRWRPTRQPVLVDQWPVVARTALQRFTTIASWRGSYGRVEFAGRSYGLKVHEFRKFCELPARCASNFEIALDIHPADSDDLTLLRDHGWKIVNPKQVASSAEQFRQYIQSSDAEFSVAQGIYVETHCGWFSDRTVRYLMSGRPALVQDTGFSRNLPAGEGLLAFRTIDEAIAGASCLAQNYTRHCRAARAIAAEHFDSNKVLQQMLCEVGLS